MRLRLATKFSAIIVGIFALSLLSNVMALFVAWRVGKRMDEITTADVPSASAAQEFRAALLEERAVHTAYLLQGGRSAWLDGLKRAESHFQNALGVMRGAADRSGDENDDLLKRLDLSQANPERFAGLIL